MKKLLTALVLSFCTASAMNYQSSPANNPPVRWKSKLVLQNLMHKKSSGMYATMKALDANNKASATLLSPPQ